MQGCYFNALPLSDSSLMRCLLAIPQSISKFWRHISSSFFLGSAASQDGTLPEALASHFNWASRIRTPSAQGRSTGGSAEPSVCSAQARKMHDSKVHHPTNGLAHPFLQQNERKCKTKERPRRNGNYEQHTQKFLYHVVTHCKPQWTGSLYDSWKKRAELSKVTVRRRSVCEGVKQCGMVRDENRTMFWTHLGPIPAG
jgi:hypothetical protein